MNKEQLLNVSESFCMLPWMHMHILPGSSAVPCCVWPYDQEVGNVKNQSLKEIWNGEEYKELRRKMLNGEKVAGCNQCYQRDAASGHSLRKSSNEEWGYLYDEYVATTESDGTLTDYKMALFDVRFSNICNFKCRGCSPELSSSWLSDHEKLYDYKSTRDKLISITPNPKLWEELVEFLPTVERAYFAGGEPLIMDEHYLILEEFIKLGKTDVKLSYNSNMSNLRFRDKLVMEYWNKFDTVGVGVSIDDIEARGEYFRHGMDWEKTVANIQLVQKNCPHVYFSVNCTVSLFNVYYLPEIHSKLMELGIIKLGDFFTNLLLDPHEYRLQVIPAEQRGKISKKLRDYLDKVTRENFPHDPHACARFSAAFQSVINFLQDGENYSSIEKFAALTAKVDKIRGESFATTYPELSFLAKSQSDAP